MSRILVKNLLLERGDMILGESLSFEVKKGEVFLLKGPNGCGKTTLLQHLSGIFPSEAVQIEGKILFLPTTFALFESETVLENLHFFAKALEEQYLIEEAIATFDLSGLLEKRVSTLSNGQRRRVSLARLVFAPNHLWLLDEPELGLDSVFQDVLLNLFHQHTLKGGSVVIASHSGIYAKQSFPKFRERELID